MPTFTSYPIGTPGLPWGEAEVAVWRARQTIKRSYDTDVLRVIETLSSRYEVKQYGRLDYHPDKYPLFAIKSRGWRSTLPCALVTGASTAMKPAACTARCNLSTSRRPPMKVEPTS